VISLVRPGSPGQHPASRAADPLRAGAGHTLVIDGGSNGALCSLARRRIPAGLPGGLTARWRGALSMRAGQIWPDGGNDNDGALGAVQAVTGHGPRARG